MRTISLRATTIRGSVSLQTEAVTLGELKSAIRTNGLDIPTHNVVFVDFDTEANYSNDNATIPEGNCTLMVITEKSNQGLL